MARSSDQVVVVVKDTLDFVSCSQQRDVQHIARREVAVVDEHVVSGGEDDVDRIAGTQQAPAQLDVAQCSDCVTGMTVTRRGHKIAVVTAMCAGDWSSDHTPVSASRRAS